ncbi:hypothetical protein [Paenibacillus sp. N3.4]|uniref:hypothetical protein n=1 Tax=Paenibacillus sp. N3.4 TaxID=2603222 RepID=UPI0011C8E64B|nr:hypothetical protein [Paenibacillus sp. N3.4]TXK73503.1 hypothetical protein FU659_30620 [Paenibacillus sp. N3.4]
MITVQWSSQLSNIISGLTKMEPSELFASLKDPAFVNSLKVSTNEKLAIGKVFLGEQGKTQSPWF